MRDLESLRWKPAFVVGLLSIIVFLVQMGLTLTDIPSTSLVQELTCIRQNPGVDPDTLTPEQCQSISVNREVNLIQLLSTLTTSAPAILTALIYGALADSFIGRKLIFLASLSGILLFQVLSMILASRLPSMSVETLSIAGLVLFIGGGTGVAEAMVFTMISDVAFDRWRTISFQIAICSVLLADIVAAVSTPSLMSDSVWTPLGLGALFIFIGLLLHFALPETLDILLAPSSQDRQQNTIPTLAELRAFLAHLRRNGAAISLLTPAAALTLPIATSAASILSRTTPFRYSTSFAASSILVAVRAGATIFALLVLLPPLLFFYDRLHLLRLRRRRSDATASTAASSPRNQPNPISRDLDLARAFAVFPIIGALVLAAASTTHSAIAGVVLFTLGSPVPGLARAVLSRLVDPAYRGQFFGLLAVVEQAGFLVVGLFLSGLLDAGLRNSEGRGGTQWLGLPLYIAAFLFALLALGLWLARPRELQQQQQQTPPLPNDRQEWEGEPEQVELGNLQERQPEGSGPKQPHP
ncbi:ATP synthase F0 [Apiospora sp. TS-2023a]